LEPNSAERLRPPQPHREAKEPANRESVKLGGLSETVTWQG
jgi:hypothetical protein